MPSIITEYVGELNQLGNWAIRTLWMGRGTGFYFLHLDEDWDIYRTGQDADYFGIWVNYKTMQVITYAEGDETLVTALNAQQFFKELNAMDTFYGGLYA